MSSTIYSSVVLAELQTKIWPMRDVVTAVSKVWTYCTAGNFCQRKILSKATVRQFVRNLSLSNVARRSFALRSSLFCLSSIFAFIFLIPYCWFCEIKKCEEFKFSQHLALTKATKLNSLRKMSCYTVLCTRCEVHQEIVSCKHFWIYSITPSAEACALGTMLGQCTRVSTRGRTSDAPTYNLL